MYPQGVPTESMCRHTRRQYVSAVTDSGSVHCWCWRCGVRERNVSPRHGSCRLRRRRRRRRRITIRLRVRNGWVFDGHFFGFFWHEKGTRGRSLCSLSKRAAKPRDLSWGNCSTRLGMIPEREYGMGMTDPGFHYPHCGTAYHVRTETAPYDPDNHSANCDDCGKVMATWFTNVRAVYSKRNRQPVSK
jgi:hypothetical protein